MLKFQNCFLLRTQLCGSPVSPQHSLWCWTCRSQSSTSSLQRYSNSPHQQAWCSGKQQANSENTSPSLGLNVYSPQKMRYPDYLFVLCSSYMVGKKVKHCENVEKIDVSKLYSVSVVQWPVHFDGFGDCCCRSGLPLQFVGHMQTFKNVFEVYFCSEG